MMAQILQMVGINLEKLNQLQGATGGGPRGKEGRTNAHKR